MALNRPRLPRLDLFLSAAVIALLDQASKVLAQALLPPRVPLPVIKRVLYLTYTENTGAAFGLFRDSRFLLTALSLLFLLVVIAFGATTSISSRGTRLALGAGIGGAVSNLIDRFTKHYVIDFIDFRVWPVFNLADVAIVVGIGWVILGYLLRHPKSTAPGDVQPPPERKDDNVS